MPPVLYVVSELADVHTRMRWIYRSETIVVYAVTFRYFSYADRLSEVQFLEFLRKKVPNYESDALKLFAYFRCR